MASIDILPVHKRSWHVFLSHSSADKVTFVEPLYNWLTETAKIPTFYDTESISGGQSFQRVFSETVLQCRAFILILSKTAVKSKWVMKEYELAELHQNNYPNFKIITIVLDEDADIPIQLQNRDHIFATERTLSMEFIDELLRALYPGDINVHQNQNQDIFVSRTWRESESESANRISETFVANRFRLVGDAKDRPDYTDSKDRVYDIIESCGGLLGILPLREGKDYNTSPYMIDEVRHAIQRKVPCVLYVAEGVTLPDDIKDNVLCIIPIDSDDRRGIELMRDHWHPPIKPQYIFFATNFKHKALGTATTPEEEKSLTAQHRRQNRMIGRMIERITGMKCFMGEEIFAPNDISVQQSIINIIRNSYLLISDVSQDNINTLIETGVARGAGINHYMIASGKRHRPPFMLRDEQIFYYENDAEMLGRIYMLIYPFRRRVLNYELLHDDL